MSHFEQDEEQALVQRTQIISSNAIQLYKTIISIIPIASNCIFKLTSFINAIKNLKKKLRNDLKFFTTFKVLCLEMLNGINDMYSTINDIILTTEETIQSLRIPCLPELPILYYQLSEDNLLDNWYYKSFCNIKEFYVIHNILDYYVEHLTKISKITKKTFNSNHKNLMFECILNELVSINEMQDTLKKLYGKSSVLKEIAILSTILYKDIKYQTDNRNIKTYIQIMSLSKKINIQLNSNESYKLLKQEIKELNTTLSSLWDKYISFSKEENIFQFVINDAKKSILLTNKKCYLECNKCEQCNKYYKCKIKISAITFVLQRSISISADNILILMNVHLKKLTELTYKYEKINRYYNKYTNNCENFIKKIFS